MASAGVEGSFESVLQIAVDHILYVAVESRACHRERPRPHMQSLPSSTSNHGPGTNSHTKPNEAFATPGPNRSASCTPSPRNSSKSATPPSTKRTAANEHATCTRSPRKATKPSTSGRAAEPSRPVSRLKPCCGSSSPTTAHAKTCSEPSTSSKATSAVTTKPLSSSWAPTSTAATRSHNEHTFQCSLPPSRSISSRPSNGGSSSREPRSANGQPPKTSG